MKIKFVFEQTEFSQQVDDFFKRAADEYFRILEWMIMQSLVTIWYVKTEAWYALLFSVITSLVINLYVSTHLNKYYYKRTLNESGKRKPLFFFLVLILGCVVSLLLSFTVATGLLNTY